VDVGRDISRGESVEADIDVFISRRDAQRRETEGERRERELWAESEARHPEQRREANRQAWHAFHQGQAARHRAVLESLVDHHEEQARKYGHHHEEDSCGSAQKAR
jgi:hypothetical protein